MPAGVDELADHLAAISARLREIGDGALARRLSAGIGKAVEPVEQEVRNGLRSHLPDRYAEVLGADLKFYRRTFTSADEARVAVYCTTQSGRDRRIRRQDEDGILWHPLFGRFPRRDPRNRWFAMGEPHVKPGWFSGPCENATPRVRREIENALNDITERAAAR